MQYRILKIWEDDYGCEGVPEGEEPMCRVLVQAPDGEEKWIRIPDRELTERGLDEGDSIGL